jgi:membrane associated rhomboid family serine protease
MPVMVQDYYGHETASTLGASGTAAGTVVAGAAASAAAPTAINCNDTSGSFSVVGASSAAAGILAVVYFAQPYGSLPKSILVQVYDSTGSAALLASASAPALRFNHGFNVVIATPAAGSHTLLVAYTVNT